MWSTYGHDSVKSILEKQLKSKLFSHAYLFTGPAGVGKKRLALDFAEKILNSRQLDRHPDFQILDLPGEITMAPVLELIARLNLKPFVSGRKVAIINNAENLNVQSSNALLKTLEEPAPSTVIILVANSRQLLPTILSRCQIFNFNRFSRRQLEAFAKERGFSANDNALNLSFGSSGRLQTLCQDPAQQEREAELVKGYKIIQAGSIARKLLSVSEYAKLEEQELRSTVFSWCLWQLFELGSRPQQYQALGALLRAYVGFGKSKNKKLILQNLFLNI